MGFKKNNPGCNCCGCSSECEIFTTAFTGGDSSDISQGDSGGFVASTGTWDITSNQLRCTAAGIALLNTPQPCTSIAMVVTVTFKHSDAAASVDVIVGATSATDYWYVRSDYSADTVSIRRNNGGSHSTIKTVAFQIYNNDGTTYTISVCVTPGGNVTVKRGGSYILTAFSQPITGTLCGLGSTAGTATFDNFSFYQSERTDGDGCEECVAVPSTCSDCCLATQSGITFTAEWPTAFTHISAACDGFCEQLTASDFSLSYLTTCVWRYSFAGSCVNDCSDGQDPGGLGDAPCSRGGLTLEIIRNASLNQCYLRLNVTVSNASNTTSPDRQFIAASYESAAVTSAQDFCSGDDFTLTLKTGIASLATTYRGANGWYPDYSAGCNESLPASVVVHA